MRGYRYSAPFGTGTATRVVTPKLLVDNFAKKEHRLYLFERQRVLCRRFLALLCHIAFGGRYRGKIRFSFWECKKCCNFRSKLLLCKGLNREKTIRNDRKGDFGSLVRGSSPCRVIGVVSEPLELQCISL